MKVIGTRYIQGKRKFIDEDDGTQTRKPEYHFTDLEAIVRSWPITKHEEDAE